jgi:hypothetical protein
MTLISLAIPSHVQNKPSENNHVTPKLQQQASNCSTSKLFEDETFPDFS